MKSISPPIAIFRHAQTEGPGHFATFLEARGLPWELIRIDAGDPLPKDISAFSGMALMGGPMSVNDDLPWIPPLLGLIRRAVDRDVAVLGHCLGGQLMAKALGGQVGANPIKEIGWGRVRVLDHGTARHWFGDHAAFQAFHWHGETFSIPEGAERLLESDYCANQAFALGKHLAMQCHVEMTEAMIRSWCDVGAEEIAAADSPAVQSKEAMLAAAPALLPAMTRVAEVLYSRWIEGLVR